MYLGYAVGIKKSPTYLKLSFFSLDTHSKTNNLKLPDGDVLLHAGDFSNVGKPVDIERFCEFLKEQPHAHKVGENIFTILA